MLAGLFSRFTKRAPSSYDKMLQEQLQILDESPLKPSFENDQSKMYLRAVDLNGYHSLSVIVTGCLNINAVEGCTITFVADQEEMSRKSDSEMIKGDYSQPLNIGITSLDFDMDEELVHFLSRNNIISAKISIKNGRLKKEFLIFVYPVVYQDTLIESLEFKVLDEDVIYEEVLDESISNEEE